LPDYAKQIGVPLHVIEQDTYRVVKRLIPEGKTTCSLCSRMRRGALYRFAAENGITRIALGHHRDDIIETLFLNLFYGGRIKAMPPKLLSDGGKHVVIRPLAYCSEQDIARYADTRAFPIIPCDLCGSQPNLQRQAIKEMLTLWKKKHPGRIENIFRAIGNVTPSHLADRELFDFINLENLGEAEPWTEENSSRLPVSQDSPEPLAF
jgi:tRNA 2-thiocytidine biosynthesis protein TtcA